MSIAQVSHEQKERAAREWSKIAGEPISIDAETIGGPIYGFGSEIAVLRLFRAFGGTGTASYCPARKSWYFRNNPISKETGNHCAGDAECVTRDHAEQVLAIYAQVMARHTGAPVPTGEEAYVQGLGPHLKMDWDWPDKPTPTILLEGGVSEALPGYGIGAGIVYEVQKEIDRLQIPVWLEPYASYAVCIYPK